MKCLLPTLLPLLLAACQQTGSSPEISALLRNNLPALHGKLKNDCVLVAFNLHYVLDSNQVLRAFDYKRVMVIEFFEASSPSVSRAHVALIFTYSESPGMFFIHDEKGTEIYHGSPFIHTPANLGQMFFNASGYPGIVTRVYFLTV